MKTQFKKLFTLLTFAFTTSAFSQTKDEKSFLNASLDQSVSKLDYKTDSIKIDAYKSLAAKGKTEYIKVLKTLDWFSQKEDVKKREIINTIQNDLDVNSLFFAFEEFSFDTEGFESDEAYRNLLNNFIKIAGVENKIKEIKVIKKSNFINISVLIDNKQLKYSINIKENQDWIDSNFVDQFINEQLLPSTDYTKKFFWLPAVDQIGNIVFISKKEFNHARQIGLIPADDIFIE